MTQQVTRPDEVAARAKLAALVHFFQTSDGKVVEVEHHLSNGPPETFVEGRAYDLTWKSVDGIAFG